MQIARRQGIRAPVLFLALLLRAEGFVESRVVWATVQSVRDTPVALSPFLFLALLLRVEGFVELRVVPKSGFLV